MPTQAHRIPFDIHFMPGSRLRHIQRQIPRISIESHSIISFRKDQTYNATQSQFDELEARFQSVLFTANGITQGALTTFRILSWNIFPSA